MKTAREQAEAIMKENTTKAEKRDKLLKIGLTETDIQNLFFTERMIARQGLKAAAADRARRQRTGQGGSSSPRTHSAWKLSAATHDPTQSASSPAVTGWTFATRRTTTPTTAATTNSFPTAQSTAQTPSNVSVPYLATASRASTASKPVASPSTRQGQG